MPPVAQGLAVRFWPKVQQSAGCWLWKGAINKATGYGTISGTRQLASSGRLTPWPLYAHRMAWELTHGPIPDGQMVLHACDVPHCVNPQHLFLGTQKTNMVDAQRKGRLHVQRPKGQRVSDETVARIRRMAAGGSPQVAIAHQCGVTEAYVSLVIRGKRRQHKKPRRVA